MKTFQYTIVLERNEASGYTVTVPALKGCVTQGDSIADALNCAKEAIECHLESLRLLGKHIPSDCKTVHVNAVGLHEAMIFKITVTPEFVRPEALVELA